MKSAILEINSKKRVAGRLYIKWVIHKIHQDTSEFNKNGISWLEKYVQQNIESASGMPLAVEFLDWEKSEPFGHGETNIKDGEPLFENSTVVGVTENAYIDFVEVNGEQIKALIGEGYIYSQRYPEFVKWLKSKMYDRDFPETSVEICKTEGNDFIIYENGWKEKGRVPMVYDYSGDAILGIEPSDDSAVLLELNNKIISKEEKDMPDQIVELNNKLEEKTDKINELNNLVKDKVGEIAELNSKVTEKETKIEEVTSELNSTKESLSAKEEEVNTLTSEVNELREFKKKAEEKELVAELNSKLSDYTAEEKEIAKAKIEAFPTSPSADEITSIVNEINAHITKTIIENRKKQSEVELNNSTTEDIYGDVVVEVNNDLTNEEDIY